MPCDRPYLYDTSTRKSQYNIVDKQGFIKHAFVLSFYYLLRSAEQGQQDYYKTIKEIVSLGGDTDTNACIVGGMLGALVGFKQLDQNMVKKLIECDVTSITKKDERVKGRYRPEWLSVGRHTVPHLL